MRDGLGVFAQIGQNLGQQQLAVLPGGSVGIGNARQHLLITLPQFERLLVAPRLLVDRREDLQPAGQLGLVFVMLDVVEGQRFGQPQIAVVLQMPGLRHQHRQVPPRLLGRQARCTRPQQAGTQEENTPGPRQRRGGFEMGCHDRAC